MAETKLIKVEGGYVSEQSIRTELEVALRGAVECDLALSKEVLVLSRRVLARAEEFRRNYAKTL